MRKICHAVGISLLIIASTGLIWGAKDTLTICDDVADPVGLDPHFVFDNKTYNILNQIYEGLVKLDVDGHVVPSLAEKWEKVDDTTIRFHLRKDVKFHNGEDLDAAAVQNSFRRQLALPSQVTAQIATVSDVTIESPYVILVKTHTPDAVLLYRLAVFGLIVPPELAKQNQPLDPNNIPIGTGPFRFVKWDRGSQLILEANSAVLEKKGSPIFRQVVFKFIPETEQIESMIAGKVDILTDVPGTMTIRIAEKKGLRIKKRKALITHAFWFTSFRGPLQDVRVRRALNLAINKEELIRYAAFGNGYPMASLSMAGEVGHNPDIKPYPFDGKKAKELLNAAGWPKDFVLKILVIQQSEREAKVIKVHLQNVGVNVEMTVVPIATGFQIISEGKLRNYDIHANLAPDVMGHLFFLSGVCFYSRSPVSAGGFPGFDEKYDAMMQERDPIRHEKLARELDRWIHDQALAVFTYQRLRTYGIREDIDFNPPLTGILDLGSIGPVKK